MLFISPHINENILNLPPCRDTAFESLGVSVYSRAHMPHAYDEEP